MENNQTHQFGLFGFIPDKLKIMDKKDKAYFARIMKNGKTLVQKGDFRGAAEKVREFREFLETIERRLDGIEKVRKDRRKRAIKPGDKVMIEMHSHGKCEIVDAIVLSINRRKEITVKTYWNRVLVDQPPELVRRR